MTLAGGMRALVVVGHRPAMMRRTSLQGMEQGKYPLPSFSHPLQQELKAAKVSPVPQMNVRGLKQAALLSLLQFP